MAFDQFGYILVLKSNFDEKNYLSMGTPYTFDEGMSCHSTRIELFYFDDNFRRIAQWVHSFYTCIEISARACIRVLLTSSSPFVVQVPRDGKQPGPTV